MKPVKFIVFADAKTHCEKPGDNFLQALKLEYGVGQEEKAIGLRFNKTEKLSAFDDSYDIYLFNDIFSIPNDDSIFFASFINSFFSSRTTNDYKFILHRSSNWNFNSFDLSPDSFYLQFAEAINWFKASKENETWIYQSHTPSDVYGKELKEISYAIISNDEDQYEKALNNLKLRFSDRLLETFLKPFENIIPLLIDDKNHNEKLIEAKTKLIAYLHL
jgi:hypothetical protein